MTWRDAFLAQARSDSDIRRLLNEQRAAYAHQLHYLQMMTEKLAKAILANPRSTDPPRPSHVQFVNCLQAIRNTPQIRRMLGYAQAGIFHSMINSLLPLARQIEQLAPSAAGLHRPNPKYPWRSLDDQEIHVPYRYPFPDFDPKGLRMVKLIDLVERLLRLPL